MGGFSPAVFLPVLPQVPERHSDDGSQGHCRHSYKQAERPRSGHEDQVPVVGCVAVVVVGVEDPVVVGVEDPVAVVAASLAACQAATSTGVGL